MDRVSELHGKHVERHQLPSRSDVDGRSLQQRQQQPEIVVLGCSTDTSDSQAFSAFSVACCAWNPKISSAKVVWSPIPESATRSLRAMVRSSAAFSRSLMQDTALA